MDIVRDSFAGLRGRSSERLFGDLRTPCYVIDEARLRENCETLASVAERSGCRVLLAQKAFSNFAMYPLISRYLHGTEASGLFEARLGRERMPDRETHVFCAAYRDDEFDEVLRYADHVVFNSPAQLARFGRAARDAGASIGLRVNPERSTQDHAIYDPCAPGSRLGTTRASWDECMTRELVDMLDGLHFHTLCEQGADALEETLAAFDERFGDVARKMKWINMGGGHHVTRPDYDRDLLVSLLRGASERYGAAIYIEPGEAVALDAGYLVTRVLDVVTNGDVKTAILDTSAACHMPDVLEMPYRPPLFDAHEPNAAPHCYRLAGPTCLSGDIIGDWSFERELSTGDMLVFGDMAIYTTVKNNTFNGVALPSIRVMHEDGKFETLAEFGYRDFESRLGRQS